MTHFWLWRWPVSDFGERIYLVPAHHAPDEPTMVPLERVPHLFAVFAIESRWNDNLRILQEVYCELTLASQPNLLHQDQREVRDRITPRIRQALEHGELVAFRECRAAASFAPRAPEVPGLHSAPAASRPPRPPTADNALSFYEIILLDELEIPLADVSLRVGTPAGRASA
jgi:hypothetical protein